jgi:hypothetical protein
MTDNETSFTIDIPVKGQPGLDAASKSVEVLAARLESASKAVKAQDSAYREAERTADRAAKAYERVGLAINAQRGKLQQANDSGTAKQQERAATVLANLIARQGELASATEKAKSKLSDEASALDKAKESAKKVAAELKAAQDAEKDPPYEKIARGLRKLGGPLADVGDKVASVGSGFSKLKASFGSSAGVIVGTTVLIVSMVAAVVGAVAAFSALVVKVAEWSVGLTDANRNSRLLAQGMTQSVKAGDELYTQVRGLARILPLSVEELTEMGKGFAYAGYRGKGLSNAIQQSALWAARLKFGPDFQKAMLGLDQQSKIFKQNISSLFGNLNIEPLLFALQRMVSLFDESTASGRAIKVVFESIFQPLVDKAASAQFAVEAFFLHMEIWALQALIALKPHASILVGLGKAFLIVSALIAGTIATLIAVAFAPLAASVAVVVGAVYAMMQVANVGVAMVEGIVNGIKTAGPKILAAMVGTVKNAVDGVKKFLGIASPAKATYKIGYQTGEGMEGGIVDSSAGVRAAMDKMAAPPAASPGTASAASGSGRSLNLSGATFTFNGVKDAETAESRFAEVLTRLMEGDAAQLGAMVPS